MPGLARFNSAIALLSGLAGCDFFRPERDEETCKPNITAPALADVPDSAYMMEVGRVVIYEPGEDSLTIRIENLPFFRTNKMEFGYGRTTGLRRMVHKMRDSQELLYHELHRLE